MDGNGYREEMPDALLTRPCVWVGVWDTGKDPALARTQIGFRAQPPAIGKGCVTVETGRARVLGYHWLGTPGLGKDSALVKQRSNGADQPRRQQLKSSEQNLAEKGRFIDRASAGPWRTDSHMKIVRPLQSGSCPTPSTDLKWQ